VTAPAEPPPTEGRRFGLFHLSLIICAGVGAVGILAPGSLASASAQFTGAVFGALDWYFTAVVTGFLVLTVWLAFGRYGRVVLGAGGRAGVLAHLVAGDALRGGHRLGPALLGRSRADDALRQPADG